MTATTTSVTRCPDGYDKTHPGMRVEYHYTSWGYLAMFMGYTALPTRIDIVCPKCGTVFTSITGRDALEKFRFREPNPDER
jgi:hypothetical protein